MININDLTIGQIKEIQSLNIVHETKKTSKISDFLIGKFVIARCYSAGVHAGYVVEVDGENVVLKDSKRLWMWKAKDGIALSGVAQHGIKNDSKVDTNNPIIYLTGVCELIPCSKDAENSINEK